MSFMSLLSRNSPFPSFPNFIWERNCPRNFVAAVDSSQQSEKFFLPGSPR
jgi:hypothetical protein